MFLRVVIVCVLCLISLQSSGQLGFLFTEKVKRVEIPIEVHNNLVVVPVILNNQLPLKFIVDTGVRTTILTEKIYGDILHLAYTKKFVISAPGGKNLINAYIANNVTIDMPGVRGRGHAMMVLENDFLELRSSLGTEVHGILGYELFCRFVVKIDYKAKKLILLSPQKFKPGRRYYMLPITVEDTKPYYVAALRINDTTSVSAKLMIDTGASHGLFLDTDSNDKIIIPQKNIECVVGRGLGGDIAGRMAKIKQLKIGRYAINEMITSFPDSKSYFDTLQMLKLSHRNGSIGGDVLSRFDVIFDFPNERIYVKPNSLFRKRSYYNMSGLTVKAEGQKLNEFSVVGVRKNSPGYMAGIQAGDKIVEINTNATETMHLNEVDGYFDTKPGKKIRMKLKRGSEILDKEFRLVNEL